MPDQTELLKLLNRFTKREHQLDEVYLFDLILCDNEIDRDGDCFSDHALQQLAERFVGVTGIFDHNPQSGNQTARIFRTEVCSDPERKTKTGQTYHYLRANAYMVRTAGNADLIREIDAGIKKEVSISCAVGKQICSVCGCNRLKKPCTHIKGRLYGGAKCYTVLDDVTDAYEWSFVAVPAQKGAGVTKTCGGSADLEKDALRNALDAAGGLLDRLTEELRKEVVRLCYRGGENACAKALADSTMHLDADQLLVLRQTLLTGLAAADSPAQLVPQNPPEQPQMQAFRLGKTE
jgi:hypothetical protein